MDELFIDFLAETREMLEALGGELVAWEEYPDDRARLDTIFRFFHTVKGNCGFFDFPRLEALSHAAEDVLADVRADRRKPDFTLVSAVLAVVDRIGDMIDAIENGAELPEDDDRPLIAAMEAQADNSVGIPQLTPTSEDAEHQKVSPGQRSIRLPVELLDRVMSGVSDMVLARNELARRLRESSVEAALHEPFKRLSSIIADVRDAMTRTRMQRLEGLFSSLPRLARDLSAELDKQIRIEITGSEVELDREMIEIIRNPLTHIIRNAVDHGIERPAVRISNGKPETGLLSISARQSGNRIIIDIVDDGRGIDDRKLLEKAVASGVIDATKAGRLSQRERVALIFQPGISTAEAVTAISGRGVGMDVVRANIERAGGTLEIDSDPGQGTRVSLRVPLTLTIIPALTVSVGELRFAIPRSSIEEIVDAASSAVEISRHGGAMLVKIRDHRLPALTLAKLLKLEGAIDDEERTLIVLRLPDGKLFVLAVDRLHDHEELVVKPAAPAVIATGIYAGTTLTDDGHPILLLEVAGLAKVGGLQLETLERSERLANANEAFSVRQATPVLLFRGLDGKRKAIPMAVVDRLDEVEISAVEATPDRLLVVIEDRILPLAGAERGDLPQEALRLFRLTDGRCEMGYAVQDALGVRHVDTALMSASIADDSEGVLLVDGEPTTLISPYKLFARHTSVKRGEDLPACHLSSADPWLQNFVRPIVEAAGYRVVDVGEADMDLAIVSSPDDAGPAGARQVIRLRSTPEAAQHDADSIYRYDHSGLLSVLHLSRGTRKRA